MGCPPTAIPIRLPNYTQTTNFTADQTIVTGFPSWMGQADPGSVFGAAYANELGNRMHFGFDMVATGGETFSANNVSFSSTSSPGGGLDRSFGAGTLATYSLSRIGIAADHTVYDNGEAGSLPVVQLIY